MLSEHTPIRGKLAYSIPEFCKIAGVGKTKAYEEIAAGRLKAKKAGSRTLITAESGQACCAVSSGGWRSRTIAFTTSGARKPSLTMRQK